MKVICPSCNADYNIPEAQIPANGAQATCKRCKGKIVIMPPATTHQTPIIPTSEPMPAAPPAEPSREPKPPKPATPRTGGSGTEHPAFADYPKLRDVASPRLDFDEILTVNKKGGYKNGKNKIKIKIIKSVAPVLESVLENDEVVKKVARGILRTIPWKCF